MDRSIFRAAGMLTTAIALSSVALQPAGAVARTSKLAFNTRDDLFTLFIAEESYLTDIQTHYASFKQLAADHDGYQLNRGVTLQIVHIDGAKGYCLRASSRATSYMYDSEASKPVYAGTTCKVTTHGRSGGTRHWTPPNSVPPPYGVRAEH
jgi:hypothetical protein